MDENWRESTIKKEALEYHEASPKIVILISFVVGWISNELISTLDNAIGDLYEIAIEYLKHKFKGGKK